MLNATRFPVVIETLDGKHTVLKPGESMPTPVRYKYLSVNGRGENPIWFSVHFLNGMNEIDCTCLECKKLHFGWYS